MARLRHGLSTLRPVSCLHRTQDSLLARLCQAGFAPAGFRRKVSLMSLTSVPPFPSFLAQTMSPFPSLTNSPGPTAFLLMASFCSTFRGRFGEFFLGKVHYFQHANKRLAESFFQVVGFFRGWVG